MEQQREKIKIFLITNKLSNIWLVEQLKKYNLIVRKDTLSRYINGDRENDDAKEIFNITEKIISDYEIFNKRKVFVA